MSKSWGLQAKQELLEAGPDGRTTRWGLSRNGAVAGTRCRSGSPRNKLCGLG